MKTSREATELQVPVAQLVRIPEAKDSGRYKRHRVLDNSDSNKKFTRIEEGNQLAIVSSTPSQGEWRKVEKNKFPLLVVS